MATEPGLVFFLNGRFRIETSSGEVVTPRGAKAQALLALLATDPHLTRTRAWLQDKLWTGDADASQANLRQALRTIRRNSPRLDAALVADRQTLGLAPALIRVVDAQDAPEEFLEGLDVSTPGFNEWLRLQRSQRSGGLFEPAHVQVARPVVPMMRSQRQIVLETISAQPTRARVVEDMFCDRFAASMREMFDIDAHVARPEVPPPGALVVSARACPFDTGDFGLRVAISEPDSGRVFWTDTVSAPLPEGGSVLGLAHLSLCHRAVVAVRDALMKAPAGGHREIDADILANEALRNMFTMRPEGLKAAERQLLAAREIDPRGLFSAWLSQLAVIRYVESGGAASVEAAEAARQYCADALAAEPTNSNVLCSVANARLALEKDGQASRELSKLAVTANPSNPLAWWSWSTALLYTGEAAKAHSAARTAQILAKSASFRFWADFQLALTAAVTGRRAEAIANFESSRALNPAFRPPLRYLVGLYSLDRNTEGVIRSIGLLRQIEPDFTIDRFLGDAEYPVSMMRQEGLVDAGFLRGLG